MSTFLVTVLALLPLFFCTKTDVSSFGPEVSKEGSVSPSNIVLISVESARFKTIRAFSDRGGGYGH